MDAPSLDGTVPPPRRTRWWRLAVAFAAVYSVTLAAVSSWQGPGIGPDSVAYVSSAQNFLAGNHLTMFNGQPLVFFPPGLPLALAGLSRAGLTFEDGAMLLNCLAAAGMVLATWYLALKVTRSDPVAALAGIAFAVSTASLSVQAMLWTEPVAGLAMTVWLILLHRIYTARALSATSVAGVVVTSALACSFRYAGVCFIPVTLVVVFAALRHRGTARASVSAAAVATSASLGLAAVAVRNLSLGAGPLGERAPSEQSVVDVLKQYPVVLGRLVVNSENAPEHDALVVGLVFALALAAGWLCGLLTSPSVAAPHDESGSTLPVWVAVAVYWLFLGASQLTADINPINYRLVYPILPATVVAVSVLMQRLARSRRESVLGQPLARWVAGCMGGVLLAVSVMGVGPSVANARTGIRYNEVGLLDEPWINPVRLLPPRAGLVSDNPYLVYWLTGRQPLQPAIGLEFYGAATPEEHEATLREFIRTRPLTYLLWLGDDVDAGLQALNAAGISTTPAVLRESFALFKLTVPTDTRPSGADR